MLKVLYRGPLVSCNFDCGYCPFGKATMSRAELTRDAAALERFVAWARCADDDLGIFFTPWGESLVHRHVQRAMVELSHLPHVRRVAVQTNLSCRLDWLDHAETASVGIWATWHPAWVPLTTFVDACEVLDAAGVSFSAGIVGKHDHIGHAEALRAALPEHVYVWVNAVKKQTYSTAELQRLVTVDPLFTQNVRAWPSRGDACGAGHDAISVNGDGDVRRCHFLDAPLGNLYDGSFRRLARPAACPADTCGCHIGYVHLRRLNLQQTYGDGILERVPRTVPPPRFERTTR